MIIVVCTHCGLGIRVIGDLDESRSLFIDWSPDNFPCPRDGCDGTAKMVDTINPEVLRTLDMHDLTPQEAFAAFHQVGLPPERECGPEAVRSVFAKSPVKRIEVEFLKGTHRSILSCIEFEDGTRVHLAAAAEGALVYRISTPHSYTREALNEQG